MQFADLDGIRRGTACHALKGWRISSPVPSGLSKHGVTSSPVTCVCLFLVTCYREISSDVSANFDRMTLGVGTGDVGAARDGYYRDH